MNPKGIRTLLFAAIVVVALLVAFGFVSKPGTSAKGNAVFSLQAPPFVGIARAEPGSAASAIGDEAGISAYYQASTPIVFTADFKTAFRTIEAETANYIIGSVAVENYPESEDVHVYVHTDGWMMAYYLKADPVGKIFDWKIYTGASLGTKLEKTLIRVASFAGVTYTSATFYDFRYPDANRLMLIAENYSDGNSFTVQLPSSFTYYERSWGVYSIYCYDCRGYWYLDGQSIWNSNSTTTVQGVLTAAQLLPDTTHTISVNNYGGLALVYRVP